MLTLGIKSSTEPRIDDAFMVPTYPGSFVKLCRFSPGFAEFFNSLFYFRVCESAHECRKGRDRIFLMFILREGA